MDIKSYYNTNKDFKSYVDRLCKQNRMSAEEALKTSIARRVAEHYQEKEENKTGETK